jgi:Uma2 family endonuclease
MGEPKQRAGGKATYQDVIDAPEHMIAEILNGELVLSPRPAKPHAFTHTALTTWTHGRFGRGGSAGGWLILLEPEIHLGDNVVVPDLGGWRLERSPGAEDEEAYFRLPPDWACEVLSRSTERYDRAYKLGIYAEHGVDHVWFVHPLRRTLEVLRRQGRDWVISIHKDDQVVRAEPFDGFELELATLWSDSPPRPTGSRAAEQIAAYDDQL